MDSAKLYAPPTLAAHQTLPALAQLEYQQVSVMDLFAAMEDHALQDQVSYVSMEYALEHLHATL
jgi:hypothetical protein